MSNSEENYESNNDINANDPDENQSETSGQSGQASESQSGTGEQSVESESLGIDSKHNTGNERMRIDEEGAEIGPDDEV